MTKSELHSLMNELAKVFDTVQLVDATTLHLVERKGTEYNTTEKLCFDTLGLDELCEFCIAHKASLQQEQLSQFEMHDGTLYYIIAKHIEMDGKSYVLELISKVNGSTIFHAFGKTEFIQNLVEFSNTMYIDPLTGAYNRLFFEEKFAGLENHCGVAFIDLDKFKSINDSYGHDAGDKALKAISQMILSKIRPEDALIRYGGDEFVLSFAQMPEKAFVKRLYDIHEAAKKVQIPEYPYLNMTLSIGGFYCKGCSRPEMVLEADRLCYEAKVNNDDVKIRIA